MKLVATLVSMAVMGSGLVGCFAPPAEENISEARGDGLSSTAMDSEDMLRVPDPQGMPDPWAQPESEGWFGERGQCGQTATANLLRLYGIQISPRELYEQGVYSGIGTRATVIANYLAENRSELGCRFESPDDGPQFLRTQLHSGHPVMILFKTGYITSHWVTAVGTAYVQEFGNEEGVVVMNDGQYEVYRTSSLDNAWSSVYGMGYPSIVCNQRAPRMLSRPTPPSR